MDDQFQLLMKALENAKNRSRSSLEDRLSRWAQSPSQTEIEKCERAERMIREAIWEDPKLSQMPIKVFAKGSYANRTNIPSESDVDIGVLHEAKYFDTYPDGMSDKDFGMVTSSYSFSSYFGDVTKAIQNKFGNENVTVTAKCITVHSNTCRVDADVVPHFVHRRFLDKERRHEGVALQTSEKVIRNWPEQDYKNGVAKNDETSRGYKALVRILKNIRTEMAESGIRTADYAKSYLIACLVWNVPNSYFNESTYEAILSNVLDYLIWKTSSVTEVNEWGEVNELKYLFRSSQPWKLEEVQQFLRDAKSFVETLR